MSYILDAVRKAEEERCASESAAVRSLSAQAPLADTQRKPRYWLVAIACLALFNLALWISFAGNEDDAATKVRAAGPAENQAQQVAPVVQGSDEANADDIEKTAEVEDLASARSASLSSAQASSDGLQEMQQLKLWQASSSAQTAIGSLDFSFHVYSTDKARRTIIIDQQRMREGDRISEALRLEQITETGVLLAFENSLVEVDILEQW